MSKAKKKKKTAKLSTSITKSTLVSLKFTNKEKQKYLDKLFKDYMFDLQYYIDLIYEQKLPLKTYLSSKDLPTNILKHSKYKASIYKKAAQIVQRNNANYKNQIYRQYKRTYRKAMQSGRYKFFTNKRFSELYINYKKKIKKPNIEYVPIQLNDYLYTNEISEANQNKYFNQFIGLRLPYFYQNKKRAINIKLPILYHKHYRQLNKTFKRANTINLVKKKDNYYIQFIFTTKTKDPLEYTNKKVVGVDIGFKKTIFTSNGRTYGSFKQISSKIKNKKQGSNKYKRALKQRTNEMNYAINLWFKQDDFDTLIIEDIKYILRNKKTKYNGLNNWTYSKLLKKIQNMAQLTGVQLLKVSPAYTSRKCSNCGDTTKTNRKQQIYQCCVCGILIDSDFNAALNILQRGLDLLKSNKDRTSYTKTNSQIKLDFN